MTPDTSCVQGHPSFRVLFVWRVTGGYQFEESFQQLACCEFVIFSLLWFMLLAAERVQPDGCLRPIEAAAACACTLQGGGLFKGHGRSASFPPAMARRCEMCAKHGLENNSAPIKSMREEACALDRQICLHAWQEAP